MHCSSLKCTTYTTTAKIMLKQPRAPKAQKGRSHFSSYWWRWDFDQPNQPMFVC